MDIELFMLHSIKICPGELCMNLCLFEIRDGNGKFSNFNKIEHSYSLAIVD